MHVNLSYVAHTPVSSTRATTHLNGVPPLSINAVNHERVSVYFIFNTNKNTEIVEVVCFHPIVFLPPPLPSSTSSAFSIDCLENHQALGQRSSGDWMAF